jgi:cytochrome c553
MTRRATFAIVLAVLGACLAGPRIARAEEAAALFAYGRRLASECTACHNAEAGAGAAARGGIPVIAGRPASELTRLLGDFHEGRRTNPVMVSVARSLDERQIAALAAYFASLPPQPSSAARSP